MFVLAFSQPLKHCLVFIVLIQLASLTYCRSLSKEGLFFIIIIVLFLVKDVRPAISRFNFSTKNLYFTADVHISKHVYFQKLQSFG